MLDESYLCNADCNKGNRAPSSIDFYRFWRTIVHHTSQLWLASALRLIERSSTKLGMTGEGRQCQFSTLAPIFLEIELRNSSKLFSSFLVYWCVRAGVTNTLPPHLKHLLCPWSKVPLGYFFSFPCPMRINHTPS